MATTECPDCAKHFVGTRCECGYSVARIEREGYRKLTMPETRPCTLEQNKAAWRITQDVLERKYPAAEGRRRLAALFQMPELVNE